MDKDESNLARHGGWHVGHVGGVGGGGGGRTIKLSSFGNKIYFYVNDFCKQYFLWYRLSCRTSTKQGGSNFEFGVETLTFDHSN